MVKGTTFIHVTRRHGDGETRGITGARDEGRFIVGMVNKRTRTSF